MRTTITLEDDVAAELAQLQKRRDLKFKDAVNLVLREGLRQLDLPEREADPVVLPTHHLGRCLIGNVVNVAEALAIADGEDHR